MLKETKSGYTLLVDTLDIHMNTILQFHGQLTTGRAKSELLLWFSNFDFHARKVFFHLYRLCSAYKFSQLLKRRFAIQEKHGRCKGR